MCTAMYSQAAPSLNHVYGIGPPHRWGTLEWETSAVFLAPPWQSGEECLLFHWPFYCFDIMFCQYQDTALMPESTPVNLFSCPPFFAAV